MNKISPEKELQLCLKLWEKKGGCRFGGGKQCAACATPYLLWKMMTGEIIHEKLSIEDWKKKSEAGSIL